MGIFDKLFGKKEPSSGSNKIKLGKLYNSALNNAQKGNFKKSFNDADIIINHFKDTSSQMNKISDEAKDIFNINLVPMVYDSVGFRLIDVHHVRATAAMNLSDFKSALKDLDFVISNDENYADSYFTRSQCHFFNYEDTDIKASIKDMKKFKQLKPNDSDGERWINMFNHIIEVGNDISDIYKSEIKNIKKGFTFDITYGKGGATLVNLANKIIQNLTEAIDKHLKLSNIYSKSVSPYVFKKTHKISLPLLYYRRYQSYVFLFTDMNSKDEKKAKEFFSLSNQDIYNCLNSSNGKFSPEEHFHKGPDWITRSFNTNKDHWLAEKEKQ